MVSVFDWAVLRGFGVFEVIRSYDGALFRLDRHLDRLARSAAALGIPMPDRAGLAADTARVAANGDGQVRVVLTGGGRDAAVAAPPRAVVMWEPLPQLPERVRVTVVVAPWHPATDAAGYPGVKWTSYAPNMATTDLVRSRGFDDAVLVTVDGLVLEGPTFSYAWVHDGALETPSLRLGILPSITREVLLECCVRLDVPVTEGRYPISRMTSAVEVLALSTVKQVGVVESIDGMPVPGGPVTARIASTFAAIVAAETGPPPRP